ncbi:glycoside hydrolase family 32 protein [Paenibacillus sp. FSL H8-0537]|uniref:glycoside hydrolase family 32 protein n=1 Tax=Paenibacillus sp. FSL H8-0537 TaxID=2921399 RepID=UPI003101940B
MLYTLENAEQFVAERKHLLCPQYRLGYHLMAEFGWMNDPNGFIFHNGHYHLFYQYYPYQPAWGPMHWGHAISRDLVTWEYAPAALAPDQPYDSGGCFSGSAIVHEGKLHLMYTGHVVTGPNGDTDYYQTQNIAVSGDGVTFAKLASNPVLGLEQIPAGTSRKDFRDPKVFVRDGFYYTVIGSNDGAGHGLILLYRSQNLVNWAFVGEMARSDGQMGDNWECPDLFELDGYDVLIMSPQRMPAQGDHYRNLHSTTYMVGKLNTETGSFSYDGYDPVDFGFDFYAPQTALDPQGRRIVIGWMETWEQEIPTQLGHYWAGAMTLPREAVLRSSDRKLLFQPLEELNAYRRDSFELSGLELAGEQLLAAQGECYELEVVLRTGSAREFGLKLRTNGAGEETVLAYDAEEGLFRFNRDRSGIGQGGERRTDIALAEGGDLSLRIFVDQSSVEVFLQGGEKVMTGRIYPGEASTGIAAFALGGTSTLVSLKKWNIERQL